MTCEALYNNPKVNLMNTIYLFLATGFEEVEALGIVDACRRGGLTLKTVSVTGNLLVESSHGVKIQADALFEDCSFDDADMLVLPGGMPGSTNLKEHEGLRNVILKHYEASKPLAAICAAPMVYGSLGLLKGKKATCYPGFDKYLEGAEYTGKLVEHDGQFFTGKGAGAAFALGFAIVEHFCGKEVVENVKNGVVYNDLLASANN